MSLQICFDLAVTSQAYNYEQVWNLDGAVHVYMLWIYVRLLKVDMFIKVLGLQRL